jgi:DNA-binding response OmpR family regulator
MQLLIVHDDAEVGEQLVQMVKEYTEHHCGFATSDAGALDWARGVSRCSLLITQLRGNKIDGLSLGGSLSEIFAGLQTMFLPAYPATEQRIDLTNSKVFPEPIDGERLLNAIARAEEQRQTGMDLFHALDVLQMCCLSGRDGALQLVRGSQTAMVFLKAGNIVHAERGATRDAEALYEIAAWEAVEFAYDQYVRAPAETIGARWDELLVAAVTRRKKHSVGATASAASPTPPPAAPASPKGRWGLFGGGRK